jgi:hypothetical protein
LLMGFSRVLPYLALFTIVSFFTHFTFSFLET